METTCDVVIVGARCGGAALARLLAKAGLRVIVIDRASFPSDTHSTHSISTNGTELLHAWGVLDDVVALGAPNLRELSVGTPSLSMIVPLPEDGYGMIAPRRTVLDKLLGDLAREAGADVWEQTTFLGVLGGGGEAVRGITCRRADGATVEIHASIVVGADGVDSAVAAAVGAESYAVRPSQCAGVYGYYRDSELEAFGLGLTARRLALAIPTTGGEICFAVGGHSDDVADLSRSGDEGAAAFIEQTAPTVAAAIRRGTRTSRLSLFRPRQSQYRVPFGSGWALVGDAGHYIDPFTGQGISNAFLGADLLARALIAGLGGGADTDTALAGYHAARDEMTNDLHEVTHQLSMFDWDEAAGIELIMKYRGAVDQTRQRVLGLYADSTYAVHQ